MIIFRNHNILIQPLIQKAPPAMKHIFTILLATFLIFNSDASAQKAPATATTPLIQFSGVVLDQDSLSAIPFVSVLVKGTRRGTISDVYGFFTLVVNAGDELEFSSITHKSRNYKIADTTK